MRVLFCSHTLGFAILLFEKIVCHLPCKFGTGFPMSFC